MTIPTVGIDAASFATARYVLDLALLAERRGIDPDKYRHGLGQEQMSVAPPNEDIVTLAAAAAKQALEGVDRTQIGTLLFATESSVDQSKAAGLWVHHLLGLSPQCRVVELKQACYSATCALQLAMALIRHNPRQKVLLLASDIARYGLNTPGEPTQGCGACALLLSADPRLIAIEPEYGLYTEHVMDFWRPNYLDAALVDGKYSTRVYLTALSEAWGQYAATSGRTLDDHLSVCYHLPFTRMAEKAHERLCRLTGSNVPLMQEALIYNRRIGNSYTAALYIGLISLLEQATGDLAGQRLGLFSYGSGCVAEFFSGIVQPGYHNHLQRTHHEQLLDARTALTCDAYEELYRYAHPRDDGRVEVPSYHTAGFQLTAIDQHKRLYA